MLLLFARDPGEPSPLWTSVGRSTERARDPVTIEHMAGEKRDGRGSFDGATAVLSVAFTDRDAVVSVVGECDLADRAAFRSAFALVRERAPQHVVLDLSDADFIGVPLLHEIERERQVMSSAGGTLSVENARGIVKRVLDLVEFPLDG
jgi:anti-anti-sigma regulatory factor